MLRLCLPFLDFKRHYLKPTVILHVLGLFMFFFLSLYLDQLDFFKWGEFYFHTSCVEYRALFYDCCNILCENYSHCSECGLTHQLDKISSLLWSTFIYTERKKETVCFYCHFDFFFFFLTSTTWLLITKDHLRI